MFTINKISSESGDIIRHFQFEQDACTRRVILCTNSTFFDELTEVFMQKRRLTEGTIEYDGVKLDKKFVRRYCCFITAANNVFPNMNVGENIFTDSCRHKATRGKRKKMFRSILQETKFEIDLDVSVRELTVEQCKVVEILRAVYQRPKLLVIRELNSILSAPLFYKLVEVLQILNERGTTVVYLTNQWEEAVRLNSDVSVVLEGNYIKTFTAQEVSNDPGRIYDLCVSSYQSLLDNRRFKKGLIALQNIKHSVKMVSSNHNYKKAVGMFSEYLKIELQAKAVAAVLVSAAQKTVTDIVAVSGMETEERERITLLNKKMLLKCADSQKDAVSFFKKSDPDFNRYFDGYADHELSACYAVQVGDDNLLVLQIDFQKADADMEYITIMTRWIADEMVLSMERMQQRENSLLLQEGHHRIMNNLQIIVSLLEMEKLVICNKDLDEETMKEIDAIFSSNISRISCIAGIHKLLTNPAGNTGIYSLSRIIHKINDFYQSRAKLYLTLDEILIPYSKVISIAMVINELINNSIKHNEDKRNLEIRIQVSRALEDRFVRIQYRDNGKGFMNKTCQNSQNTGIGMMVIESVIVDEMNGKMKQYSQGGAVVEIEISVQSLLPIEIR